MVPTVTRAWFRMILISLAMKFLHLVYAPGGISVLVYNLLECEYNCDQYRCVNIVKFLFGY